MSDSRARWRRSAARTPRWPGAGAERRQGGQPAPRRVRPDRQDALQEEAAALTVADRAEPLDAGVAGEVQLGGVLDQQGQPRTARRLPGLVPVRRGQGVHRGGLGLQEAVARLEHRRGGRRRGERGAGIGGEPGRDGDEPPGPAGVPQVAGAKRLRGPLLRVEHRRRRGRRDQGQHGRRGLHPQSLPPAEDVGTSQGFDPG